MSNVHSSTSFLNYLIFPTLTLSITRPRPSFFTQIVLCFSTNDKFPLEILEPNMVYDKYQEKNYWRFFSPSSPDKNSFFQNLNRKNLLTGSESM